MALILSNISGSAGEGFLTGSEGVALIAVTGAMAISADEGLDYGVFAAAETNFYVKGAEGAKAAVFVGDVEVDGNLTLVGEGSDLSIEGDVLIEGGLTVEGQSEFQDTVYVTGGLYLDPANEIEDDYQAVHKLYVDSLVDDVNITITISGSDDGTTTGALFEISGGDTLTLSGKQDQIQINLSEGEIQIELTDDVSIPGELTATTGSFLEDLSVGRDLSVAGDSLLEGQVTMKDGLVVTGTLFISDDEGTGGLVVEGDVTMEDNVDIKGNLAVDGTTTLNDAVQVTAGGMVVTGGLYIDDATNFDEVGEWHAATKGYIDDLIAAGFSIAGDEDTTDGGSTTVSGGDLLALSGTVDQVQLTVGDDSITFALTDDVTIVGDFSAVSGSFSGDLDVDGDVTIKGDLIVQGTTTTIDSENVLIKDPFVILASDAQSADQDGGIIILSGANDGSDLAFGRVDDDTWGVVKLDSQNGEISDLDSGALVNFRAEKIEIGSNLDYLGLDANDLHLHANESLILCATGSGEIVMRSFDGSVEADWLTFDVANNAILPSTDNDLDLGSINNRFRNVFTGDLHLQNDRGSWTLIEEASFITFRNNHTGRRFKMVMEDITDSGTYGPGNDGKM